MVRAKGSFAWLVPEVGVLRTSLKYCRVTSCPLTPSRGFCTGGEEGKTNGNPLDFAKVCRR